MIEQVLSIMGGITLISFALALASFPFSEELPVKLAIIGLAFILGAIILVGCCLVLIPIMGIIKGF